MQASTSEKIITYSALFISVTALVLSLIEVNNMRDQTRLLQEQNKTAVWPEINATFDITMHDIVERSGTKYEYRIPLGSPVYSIVLRNDGVGPAKIHDMFVLIEGKPVQNNEALFQALGVAYTGEDVQPVRTRDITLPATAAMRVFITTDSLLRARMMEKGSEITLGFCYQSIYGDNWFVERQLTANSHVKHAPCATCPWHETDAFANSINPTSKR